MSVFNNSWDYGNTLKQSGQLLIGAGSGNPVAAFLTSSNQTLTYAFGSGSINLEINANATFFNPLQAGFGGTGEAQLTSFGVLLGEGSRALDATASGTDGQLLIAETGADPAFATISSSGHTISFTFGPNSLNIDVILSAITYPLFFQVPYGGTGRSLLTAFGVLIGEGSRSVNVTAPGTNGQTLIASTAGDPSFAAISSSGNTLTFTFGQNSLNMELNPYGGTFLNPLQVPFGGTGQTILIASGVLLGRGTNAVTATAPGTDGQLLVGSSTGDAAFAAITSSASTLTFSPSSGNLNLDLNAPVNPSFGGTGQVLLTTSSLIIGEGSNAVHVANTATDGQMVIAATGADPSFSTITSSDNSLAFTFGPNSLNMDVSFSSYAPFHPVLVPYGGTGQTILTAGGVLLGEGSNQIHVTAAGTDGQLFAGSSTGDPAFTTISSSLNSLVFTPGNGSLNIDVNIPLVVNQGGTGQTFFAQFGVLLGEGSNAINETSPGLNGQVLIGAAGADPQFASITSLAGSVTFTVGPNSLDLKTNFLMSSFFNPLQLGSGGTSRTVLTRFGVLLGEGSNAAAAVLPGTDGQLLLGSTTGNPRFASLSSSSGALFFTRGHNSLNIEMNALPLQSGGTGRSLLTTFGVLLGEGSNRISATSAGTHGQVLLGLTGGNPRFATITSTGRTLTFTAGPNSLNVELDLAKATLFNPLPISKGGTGLTLLTLSGVLLGEGSRAVNAMAAGTDGQILIGSSTGDPRFATISSSLATILFSPGHNSLTLDLAAPIPVRQGGSSGTVFTMFGVLLGEGSNPMNASDPGTDGQVLLGSTNGDPKFAAISSTGGTITFVFGPNSINLEAANLYGSTFFNPLQVGNGGTGRTVLTVSGVLIGEGSNSINVLAAGTDGQALIGSSTGDPGFAAITSSLATLTFSLTSNGLNIDLSAPLPLGFGGTNQVVLTRFGVLLGEGSLSLDTAAIGTNGQVLLGSSSGNPAFATFSSIGNTITYTLGANSLNFELVNLFTNTFFNPVQVGFGGTGQTVLTKFGVLLGEGSNRVHAAAPGTNGQVLIASTTADPGFASLTSSRQTLSFVLAPNFINVYVLPSTSYSFLANSGSASPQTGIVTLAGNSSIKTIGTGSTIQLQLVSLQVQNEGTGQTLLTTFGVLIGEGSNDVNVTSAGTNGQILIASTTGDPAFATLTSSAPNYGATFTFAYGPNSMNIEVFVLYPLMPSTGSTGRTVFTRFGVLIGEGSNSVNTTAAGTRGQTLIASTTGDPAFSTITSSGGTFTFVFGSNSINIETIDVDFYPVQSGGTGRTVLTRFGVLIGEGSNNVNVITPGTHSQVLIASTTGDPDFVTITSTGGTLTFQFGPNSLNINVVNLFANSFFKPLLVGDGGTGRTVLTRFGVLIGEGSNNVNAAARGTHGQILIASTTGDPKFATITSTGRTLSFSFGPKSLNIDAKNLFNNTFFNPLKVASGGTGRTILTRFGVLIGEGSNNVNAAARGTHGQILIASTTGDPKFASLTSTGGTFSFTFGPNSFNIDAKNLFANTFFNPLNVGNGGTGQTLLTAFGVLIGEGSNKVNVTAPGTDGQTLIAATGADPKFAAITSTGFSFTFTVGPNSLNMEMNLAGSALVNPLAVGNGGTGRTILTAFGVILGEGSNSVNVTAAGTNGQALIASTTGDPRFSTLTSSLTSILFTRSQGGLNIDLRPGMLARRGGTGLTSLSTHGLLIGAGISTSLHQTAGGTDGQVLIARTGADPKFSTITSTGSTMTFVFDSNSLSINMEINGPAFSPLPIKNGGTGQTILTTFGVLIGEGSNDLHVASPGTHGQILIAKTSADPTFSTITSTGGTLTFKIGPNSLDMEIALSALFYTVGEKGTGLSVLTQFGVLLGEGSNSVDVTARGTHGQALIAATGADPAFGTITSSGGGLTFSFGPNSLNVELAALSTLLPLASGGTNRTVLTRFGVLIGEGSNSVNVTAKGTHGQVLLAATGADFGFSTITSSGNTLTFQFGPNSLNVNVVPSGITPVALGGTGRSILTTFGVLLGEGSNKVNVTAAGTNGQTLIASTTGDPKFATITSSGATLTFTFGPKSLNMDLILPSVLSFASGGTGRTVLTRFGVLLGEGSRQINVTAAGTDGQVLLGSSTGDPFFNTISSSAATLAFGFGHSSLTMDLTRAVDIKFGGTNRTVLTRFGVLLGEGLNTINVTAPGTHGQLFIAATGADPKFSSITSTGNSLVFTAGPNSLNVDVNLSTNFFTVNEGGTGRSILTAYGVLLGEGSNLINATASGTNGQVLLAATGADPQFSTITSSGGTLQFSVGANSLNLDRIQQTGIYTIANISGGTTTVTTSFAYYAADPSSGTVTLNFPLAPASNVSWVIKDSTGYSSFRPIILTTTSGAVTFDGETMFYLINPFGSVSVFYNSSMSRYEIL